MFYAIAYAYGSTVVNNGTRPDEVYEFTRRELRDAWVSAGPADITASGYRAAVPVKHALVRKAHGKIDGDGEGWQVLAERRVNASPALGRRRAEIDVGWAEPRHWRWVATAPEREIVSWAERVRQDEG